MINKIARKPLCVILVAGAILLCLSGCGGDEGDIASPELTLDSALLFAENDNTTGAPALRVSEVSPDPELDIGGTVEAGATVEVEVNSLDPVPAAVVGVDWTFAIVKAELVEGFNTIRVVAEDTVGNQTSLTFLVEKDTTGPVATIDQFVSPASLVSVGDQTIGGTVEIGSTVELLVNSVAVGAADVQGAVWEFPVAGLVDGDQVSIRAQDALGNQADGTPLAVTGDVLLPDLSVTAPSAAELQTLRDSGTLTLQGTNTVGAEVSVLIISPLVVDSPAVLGAVTQVGDSWQIPLSNLPSGNTLVEISADDGGEISTARELVVRDLLGPAVTVNSPRHGDPAVATTDLLTVTFNEDMDAASVDVVGVATADLPSMTLTAADGTVEDGNVVYDIGSRTATFTPALPLAAGTFYTATVSSGVTDILGNFMGATYSWQFATAP